MALGVTSVSHAHPFDLFVVLTSIRPTVMLVAVEAPALAPLLWFTVVGATSPCRCQVPLRRSPSTLSAQDSSSTFFPAPIASAQPPCTPCFILVVDAYGSSPLPCRVLVAFGQLWAQELWSCSLLPFAIVTVSLSLAMEAPVRAFLLVGCSDRGLLLPRPWRGQPRLVSWNRHGLTRTPVVLLLIASALCALAGHTCLPRRSWLSSARFLRARPCRRLLMRLSPRRRLPSSPSVFTSCARCCLQLAPTFALIARLDFVPIRARQHSSCHQSSARQYLLPHTAPRHGCLPLPRSSVCLRPNSSPSTLPSLGRRRSCLCHRLRFTSALPLSRRPCYPCMSCRAIITSCRELNPHYHRFTMLAGICPCSSLLGKINEPVIILDLARFKFYLVW
jgi:hypothetical protein